MARTNNLSDFLTDVSKAIKDKKGDQTPILASNFDTEITNLPSGGGETSGDDVIFIDYDGTEVYKYSKQDFLALTEMPANPTHEGLTAQGWNWDLERAQDYVSKYGRNVIGQTYKPTDGLTKFYVTISGDIKNSYFFQYRTSLNVNTTISVDWGDGTEPEEYTTKLAYDSQYGKCTHSYQTAGDYIITINVLEGDLIFKSYSNSDNSVIFSKYPSNAYISSSDINYPYYKTLRKIILGDNVAIEESAFAHCVSLEEFIFSRDNCKHRASTYKCSIENRSLKAFIFPRGQYSNEFTDTYMLKYISLPQYDEGAWGNVIIGNALSLKMICYRENAGTYAVRFSSDSCYALETIVVPDGTLIDLQGDREFYNLKYLYISDGNTDLLSIYGYVLSKNIEYVRMPNDITKINNIIVPKNVQEYTTPESATALSSYHAYIFVIGDNLKKIIFSDSMVNMQQKVIFRYALALEEIVMPKHLKSFTTGGLFEFGYGYSGIRKIVMPEDLEIMRPLTTDWTPRILEAIDFSNTKQIPTVDGGLWNIQNNTTYKIVVPDALYDDWIVADFWSRVASQIVKASEYYGN